MYIYPSQISIETFHGCNARCTFCHVNEWSRTQGEMKDETLNEIIKQLSSWPKGKIKQTALMLNGEPLFDKKLELRLKKCKENNLPNVGFTTNAGLMTKDRAEKIVDSDPDYVVFSFDTLNKEKYEEGRLRLKYERVLSNIENFIKIRNKKNSKIRIVLRHIDFKGDKEEFRKYINFFKERLVNGQDEFSYTKVHNSAFASSIKEGLNSNSEILYGDTPCGAVFNRLTIQHDGQVVLCPHDYDGIFNFGNVMEGNLLDFFNNEEFNNIRKLHSEKKRYKMKKCDGCDEPELNKTGDMYAKYTIEGKRFYANVYTGFDRDEELKKLKEKRLT